MSLNIVNWLPRYYCAQKMLKDLPPRALVLDVACGEGDLSKFLAARGCKVWGADLCEADIRKGFSRNLDPRVAFAAADAGKLPFADASFDWVVSFDTLEVLPDDKCAMGEISRVLKRGGFVMLSVPVRAPNAGDLFPEQRLLRRWLPRALHSRSRSLSSGRGWLDSTCDDIVYFRSYSTEGVLGSLPQFELVQQDYSLKRFSALAMDVAYGVRGFPRFKLKPYLYWISSRLDAVFCRGPEHKGYTLLAKLRKK